MQLLRLQEIVTRFDEERTEAAMVTKSGDADPLVAVLVQNREEIEARTRASVRFQSELASFFSEQMDDAAPGELRQILDFCEKREQDDADFSSGFLESQEAAFKRQIEGVRELLPFMQPQRRERVEAESDKLLNAIANRIRHAEARARFFRHWRTKAAEQMAAKSQPRPSKDSQRRAIERALKANKEALAKLAKH